jgi:hypothetical protein
MLPVELHHLPELTTIFYITINHPKHFMVHGLPKKADSYSAGQVMPYFCGS